MQFKIHTIFHNISLPLIIHTILTYALFSGTLLLQKNHNIIDYYAKYVSKSNLTLKSESHPVQVRNSTVQFGVSSVMRLVSAILCRTGAS